MDFKKYFTGLKWRYYLASIAGIAVAVYLLNAIIYFPRWLWAYALILSAIAGILYVSIRKIQRYESYYYATTLPEAPELERRFDMYGRRLLNWIQIGYLEAFSFVLVTVGLGVNSKLTELLETFNGRLIVFEVVSFFIIKNILLVRWLAKVHDFEKTPLLIRTIKKILIWSTVYWIISLGIFFAFEYVFVENIGPFLTGLYVVGIVFFNFHGIDQFVYQKKRYHKIVLAIACMVVLAGAGYQYLSRDIWMTQPYINSIPNVYGGKSDIDYNEETGIYTITKRDGDFKILQLTDIHLGGSVLSYDKDLKALKACYRLMERTRPDFVIVTGDLSFPVGYASFSFNNTAPVQQFAAFMRNLGVPWAFTYGNHDTESYAASSGSDLNNLYKRLSWKTSKTLLYPYIQPDIMGRNNQLIELRNADGTLNQGLFLIDSNAYTGGGFNKYDYIHDDQVDWYKEQVLRMDQEAGHIVPSMVFFHIPLQEYREAYELYEQGSDEVTYYFGSNDEEMIDKVCCSDYPSKLFDVAKELGSTTGFFCGHDHYNNMSLEYQGMRLTYGMSIDYLAMPGIARDTKQRGGTLITVHDDGSTEIEQVPLGEYQPR